MKKMMKIVLLFSTQGEQEVAVAPKMVLLRGSTRANQKKLLLQRREQTLARRCKPSCLTQKREERRDRACGYICQFFYEAGIAHHAVTLPSFNLMLEAIGDFGRNLDGPSAHGMVVLPTPLI